MRVKLWISNFAKVQRKAATVAKARSLNPSDVPDIVRKSLAGQTNVDRESARRLLDKI